jgi:hypothetical protein
MWFAMLCRRAAGEDLEEEIVVVVEVGCDGEVAREGEFGAILMMGRPRLDRLLLNFYFLPGSGWFPPVSLFFSLSFPLYCDTADRCCVKPTPRARAGSG